MEPGFSEHAGTYDYERLERRALVAFAGGREFLWQRLLRPGFRHCLVLVKDGAQWMVVDPVSPHCELGILSVSQEEEHDLVKRLQEHGLIVVSAWVRRGRRRPAPLALLTCVEVVKRVLGIHARFVLTPWQLYRWLQDQPAPAPTPAPAPATTRAPVPAQVPITPPAGITDPAAVPAVPCLASRGV